MSSADVALVLVALIAALASIVTALIGLANHGKLEVIHVLVNSNLTEIKRQLAAALTENAQLKEEGPWPNIPPPR